MRILVAWDRPEQLELLELYLGLGGHEMTYSVDPGEVIKYAQESLWDIILMPITLPDVAGGYEVFSQLKRISAEVPVVGVCEPQEVYRVVQFVANGMSAYSPMWR